MPLPVTRRPRPLAVARTLFAALCCLAATTCALALLSPALAVARVAAAPLIESLLGQFPDYPIVVTTTTPTGSERVRSVIAVAK